jgi:hypothetical protein
MPPGSDFCVVAGDDGGNAVSTDGKMPVPFALSIAATLRADPNSMPARFGRYWLTKYSALNVNDYKLFNWFIWYDPNGPAQDYTKGGLAKDYFAEGMRIQISRDSWNDDALWFYARFNPHYSGHTFDGQGGHFSLWKNGWLIKDRASGSYPARDNLHNVVYLPPDGFLSSKEGGDGSAANGMLWHQPKILHRELTGDYIYYAADASEVFSSQEEVPCRAHWRACNVTLNQRSLFFLRKGRLLVYDRIRTKAAADTKNWQVFFASSPSDVGGGVFSVLSSGPAKRGQSRLFLKTLLPPGTTANVSRVDSDYRLRIKPQPAIDVQFLHAMEVTKADAVVMVRTEKVASASGNMVGALVDKDVVMFSADGGAVTTTDYQTSSGTFVHYVTGLRPSTAYHVTGAGADLTRTSSKDGVLTFTTNAGGTVSLRMSVGTQPLKQRLPGGHV